MYLHYTLDLWFERRFKPKCRGEAYYFRFADDFLACFQYREEAERYLKEMAARLAQFHLEVEPSKTKLLEFGRFAEESARRRGRRPETFDFLGFTHYCGHTKKGRFKVKRKTSGKKYRQKLKEVKEWLQQERSRMKKGELLRSRLGRVAICDDHAPVGTVSAHVGPEWELKSRMLGKPLVRFCEGRGGNWTRRHPPRFGEHLVYSTSAVLAATKTVSRKDAKEAKTQSLIYRNRFRSPELLNLRNLRNLWICACCVFAS